METLQDPNQLPFNDPETTPKFALVTGASAGIGWYTSFHLYVHGYNVFLGVRDVAKGQRALEKMEREAEKRLQSQTIPDDAKFGKLILVHMNLLDMQSLETVASQIEKHTDQLDLLIHNAGVMAVPWEMSNDGWEVQLQTNYIGPVLLTDRLMHMIKAAKPGKRIIYLSTIGHHFATRAAPLDTVQDGFPGLYYGFVRYGYSKTAGMQFINHLARDYPEILSISVHPGFVMETELYRHWNSLPVVGPLFYFGFRSFGALFGVNQEEGCYSTLVAALSPDLSAPNNSGQFVWTKGSQGNPSRLVTNEKYALENWNWTVEQLEGVGLSHFEKKDN